MPPVTVRELLDAGMHYGHHVSRWNPKMKPYIFGKRNSIHIINLRETMRGLITACKFVAHVVASGRAVVLVGTKRQAKRTIRDEAIRCGMPFVAERWLGGTLTNFREIRKRIGRLDELEHLESEGMLDAYSKKEGASLRRQMRKILRNLGGIRKMEGIPGAMVVIDQRREIIAVREARKLGIPVICLLDTDSDPDAIDIPIPGNDDAMRGIDIIIREICASVNEGIQGRGVRSEQDDKPAPRRRSRRPTMGRAEPKTKDADDGAPPAQAAPAAIGAVDPPPTDAPPTEPVAAPTATPESPPAAAPPDKPAPATGESV